MLGQELKTCQKKLKDAEGDVAAAAERGRAKAKQEQVTIHIPSMVYTYTTATHIHLDTTPSQFLFSTFQQPHPSSYSQRFTQDAAVAALKDALLAAERRSDAACASVDAAAAAAKMRDEKEIDLRSQVAALQRQQADMQAAAAAAAAAATKRDSVVASLEQRYIGSVVVTVELLPLFSSVLVHLLPVCLIIPPQAARGSSQRF
jgi:hypothetical protein